MSPICTVTKKSGRPPNTHGGTSEHQKPEEVKQNKFDGLLLSRAKSMAHRK